MIDPGTPAPDFQREAHDGSVVRLSDFRGKKSVVLFFYPKNDTLICTREACAFRDQHEVFSRAGAVVIGVSADTPESHQGFAARHRLPYLLLSDTAGKVARDYGVSKTLGILASRVTFLIDGQGIIRHRFSSSLNASGHVREALRVLKTLAPHAAHP